MNKITKTELRNISFRLEECKNEIESFRDKEEDKVNNYPENLQSTDTYERMEDSVDSMDSAISSIEEAIESIEEIF